MNFIYKQIHSPHIGSITTKENAKKRQADKSIMFFAASFCVFKERKNIFLSITIHSNVSRASFDIACKSPKNKKRKCIHPKQTEIIMEMLFGTNFHCKPFDVPLRLMAHSSLLHLLLTLSLNHSCINCVESHHHEQLDALSFWHKCLVEVLSYYEWWCY